MRTNRFEARRGADDPQSRSWGFTEIGRLEGVSREDAKARKVGERVPQLPKTFCGNEGVLECSGLTELWMGIGRVDGKSKAVSSHRSPRNKDPESHAKTRRRERLGIV
jgi:hypothetical protein